MNYKTIQKCFWILCECECRLCRPPSGIIRLRNRGKQESTTGSHTRGIYPLEFTLRQPFLGDQSNGCRCELGPDFQQCSLCPPEFSQEG